MTVETTNLLRAILLLVLAIAVIFGLWHWQAESERDAENRVDRILEGA